MRSIDLAAVKADVRKLGARLAAEQGPADVAHLHKLLRWMNILNAAGTLTAGLYRPGTLLFLPAIALSVAITARWTCCAHHTMHGGYDDLDVQGDDSNRFHRAKFAVGSLWRRGCDWFDWMLPEAWNVEHNRLHHYHLGEDADPDLVERNAAFVRSFPVPCCVKYVLLVPVMFVWKPVKISRSIFTHIGAESGAQTLNSSDQISAPL